ncbi:MAG: hypothetical protein FWH49_03260 [Clostridiales bacterium]|nr:hypothetical protein [Clostridiales bacterium]
MTKQHEIREAFYVKGRSISTIAGDFGVDRKTVRRYLDKNDWNELPPKETMPIRELPKLEPFKPIREHEAEKVQDSIKYYSHTEVKEILGYVDVFCNIFRKSH